MVLPEKVIGLEYWHLMYRINRETPMAYHMEMTEERSRISVGQLDSCEGLALSKVRLYCSQVHESASFELQNTRSV